LLCYINHDSAYHYPASHDSTNYNCTTTMPLYYDDAGELQHTTSRDTGYKLLNTAETIKVFEDSLARSKSIQEQMERGLEQVTTLARDVARDRAAFEASRDSPKPADSESKRDFKVKPEAERNPVRPTIVHAENPAHDASGATSTSSGHEGLTDPSGVKIPAILSATAATFTPSSAQLAHRPVPTTRSVTDASSAESQLLDEHTEDDSIYVVFRVAANGSLEPVSVSSTPPSLQKKAIALHESTNHFSFVLKAALVTYYLALLAYVLHLTWCLGLPVFQRIISTDWLSSVKPLTDLDVAAIALFVSMTLLWMGHR
jgi:hypothetical protein